MAKHSKSADSKILNRIRVHRRGWVFTPAHLADLGTRNAIGSALKRFKANGTIRQLARGPAIQLTKVFPLWSRPFVP